MICVISEILRLFEKSRTIDLTKILDKSKKMYHPMHFNLGEILSKKEGGI
jgi:hypothetical protein